MTSSCGLPPVYAATSTTLPRLEFDVCDESLQHVPHRARLFQATVQSACAVLVPTSTDVLVQSSHNPMMRYQQAIAALQHVVWSDQWCLMVNEVSGVPNEDVRSWVRVNSFTRLVGRPAYKIHPALAVLELLPRRSPCDRRVFVYNSEWAEPVRKRIDTVTRIEIARRKLPLAEAAEEQGDLLTFGEFKARVGAGAVRTRDALGVLDYQPLRLLADLRHTRYSALWVHPVREWLRTTRKQNHSRVRTADGHCVAVGAGDVIRWVS